jgi:hypothetical protein
MIQNTQIRAYLRGIPALPIERQREMATEAVAERIYEWGQHGRKINMRDMWINSLRAGDTAWLPDIRVLVLPKPPRKGGPMRDLGAAIAAVMATGAIIVDARAGVRSNDRKLWQNHVQWALDTARNSERNQKRSKANSKRRVPILRALSVKWRSDLMAKQRAQAARIWRDPIYTTAEAAQAALPEELQKVSKRTLYTIFGVRSPGDKRAGGRPRKTR